MGGPTGLKQMVSEKKWKKMSPGDWSECCVSEKSFFFFFKKGGQCQELCVRKLSLVALK